jgi:hypothetical protein
MYYLLLFHGTNGCANTRECYVVRTLSGLVVSTIGVSAEIRIGYFPHTSQKCYGLYQLSRCLHLWNYVTTARVFYAAQA